MRAVSPGVTSVILRLELHEIRVCVREKALELLFDISTVFSEFSLFEISNILRRDLCAREWIIYSRDSAVFTKDRRLFPR